MKDTYIDLRIETPEEPTNIIRVRASSFEKTVSALEKFFEGNRTELEELPGNSVYKKVFYINRTEIRISDHFID